MALPMAAVPLPGEVWVPPARVQAVVRAPIKDLEDIRARQLRRNWVAIEDAPEALFIGPASVWVPPARVQAVVRAPVKDMEETAHLSSFSLMIRILFLLVS